MVKILPCKPQYPTEVKSEHHSSCLQFEELVPFLLPCQIKQFHSSEGKSFLALWWLELLLMSRFISELKICFIGYRIVWKKWCWNVPTKYFIHPFIWSKKWHLNVQGFFSNYWYIIKPSLYWQCFHSPHGNITTAKSKLCLFLLNPAMLLIHFYTTAYYLH